MSTAIERRLWDIGAEIADLYKDNHPPPAAATWG
jgi:hypothetical protein